ncbi:ThiF family adenylyltransferase [Paenibacillus sp. GXUN7292]|uniref:ThiF family adenylyltransferase n=1 Tax=Paenibacillus sp. GXUN7292 TaxID=3422499 RepID=UPI003D7DC83E
MPGIIRFESSPSPCYQFTVVGAGATGSHFVRSVCQDIHTKRSADRSNYRDSFRYSHIMLIDGDKVEPKNMGNQLFTKEDVDSFKVQTLQEVYRGFYDVEILSYPEFVKDEVTLASLMPIKYENEIPVLIGMVDNNETRQMLDRLFRSDRFETMVYIDVGVHGVEVSRGSFLPETGNNGQIAVGVKFKNEIILEPLSYWFPGVMTDRDSPAPGCGVVVKSVPQRLTTNKFAAQLAANVVSSLIHENSVLVNLITFDARMCGSKPTFVTNDQAERYQQLLRGECSE